MKTRSILTLAIAILAGMFANGRELTPGQSLTKANEIVPVLQQSSRLRSANVQHTPVYTAEMPSDDTRAGYYVFSRGEGKGYVVLSADDTTRPVLAIVDEGNFDASSMPAEIAGWYENLLNQIDAASSELDYGTNVTALMNSRSRSSRAAIAPMLSTKWAQTGGRYNRYTPEMGGKESYAGCVAIAASQIVNYHRWPQVGQGTESYSQTTSGVTYNYNVDYSTLSLDYSKMANKLDANSSEAEIEAVSSLIYAMGVAFHSAYGTSVTTANVTYAPGKLFEHFGYAPTSLVRDRAYYGSEEWEQMVYDELAAGRPVLYWGGNMSVRHCFVVDGYDPATDLYHFNFGWGGTADGYYALTAIVPLAGYNFNYEESCITGLEPAKGGETPQWAYYQISDISKKSATATNLTLSVQWGSYGYYQSKTTLLTAVGLKMVKRNNPSEVRLALCTTKYNLEAVTMSKKTTMAIPVSALPTDGEDWLCTLVSVGVDATTKEVKDWAPLDMIVADGCESTFIYNNAGGTHSITKPAKINVSVIGYGIAGYVAKDAEPGCAPLPTDEVIMQGKANVMVDTEVTNVGGEEFNGNIVVSLVDAVSGEVAGSTTVEVEDLAGLSTVNASAIVTVPSGNYVPVVTDNTGKTLNSVDAAEPITVKAPTFTGIENVKTASDCGIRIEGRTIHTTVETTVSSLNGSVVLSGKGSIDASHLAAGIYLVSNTNGAVKIALQ